MTKVHSTLPDGLREPLTKEDALTLINGIVQRIVQRCSPNDAILVSVGVVKVIGELARLNCGDDAEVERALQKATEAVRCINVESDNDDPFSIPN